MPKRRVAQEILTDRQTDKKWTNEQKKVHQFRKQPSYDDLSPCQVGIRLDKACTSKGPEMKILTHRQMDGQSYTNFKRNLAMMVIYLPVKFEFDWTKHFWVRVRKRKCWRTDKKRTNEQKELHQFRKHLSYNGDLSPCQVWIRLDKVFLS